jgi:hypothetical protein
MIGAAINAIGGECSILSEKRVTISIKKMSRETTEAVSKIALAINLIVLPYSPKIIVDLSQK